MTSALEEILGRPKYFNGLSVTTNIDPTIASESDYYYSQKQMASLVLHDVNTKLYLKIFPIFCDISGCMELEIDSLNKFKIKRNMFVEKIEDVKKIILKYKTTIIDCGVKFDLKSNHVENKIFKILKKLLCIVNRTLHKNDEFIFIKN